MDRRGAGALTILVGSPGWKTHAAGLTPLDLASPPAGLQLITFVGPSAWDRLGIWMRSGDITGDGIADLAVGADEVDANGKSVTHNQGAVFVIRGGPHLLQSPTIVGRSGAAVVIQTNTDLHSIRQGLAGRGIETAFTHPDISLHIFEGAAFLEVPNSQFGTNYTLLRSPDLTNPTPLLTLPGNGQTLYLTDPDALSTVAPAFCRVTAQRE